MSVLSSMKFKLSNCFISNLAGATTSTLVISNLLNPLSTKPTSSLKIETYYNSLLMEYIYTNLTVAMTIPTALTYFAMTPTSSVANSLTTYQLSVTFAQMHYSGDRLLLTLPSTIALASTFACSSLTSGVVVVCQRTNSTYLQLTLTGAVMPSSVVISITNVQNNWFAGSNSFSIQTTTNDGSPYLV